MASSQIAKKMEQDMDEAMILVRENNDKDDGRVWVNLFEFVY